MEKASWESLLSELIGARHVDQYRTDADKREAQIETFDYVLQTILERLRDAAEPLHVHSRGQE